MHYEVWYTTSKPTLRGPECKFLQRFENASGDLVVDISSLRGNSKYYLLLREVEDTNGDGSYVKKGDFSEPFEIKTLNPIYDSAEVHMSRDSTHQGFNLVGSISEFSDLQIENLRPIQKHYIQTRGIHNGVSGGFSEPLCFKTLNPIYDSIEVYVSRDNIYQGFELSDTLLEESELQLTNLRPVQKHYVRLKGIYNEISSSFSELLCFKTTAEVDVFLKKAGDEYIQLQEGISSLEHTLQQLEPNTEYEVKISSKYDEENYDTYMFNTGHLPVVVGEVFNSCYIKAQKIKENDVVNILSLQLQSSDKKYLYKKEEE